MNDTRKPLGRKAYGSIGHLPGSRRGPGDHHMHEGQLAICTEKTRDRHDVVIVTEKLDGSNVAVAKVDGEIVALNRAGWPCVSAPRELHRRFAHYVARYRDRFDALLEPGEAVHGEWLALAHGTLYDMRVPFFAFDLTTAQEVKASQPRHRIPYAELQRRCDDVGVETAGVLSYGPPVSIEAARELLASTPNLTIAPRAGELREGMVWRVERRGEFDFIGKWVNPEKADGKYLPEQSGGEPVWLWRP